jgi:hypothetical protein
MVIGGEACNMRQLLHDYVHCFAFNLKDPCKFKGKETHISLDDDTFIFQRPYKLNDMELVLVKARTKELLEVGLVELSQG